MLNATLLGKFRANQSILTFPETSGLSPDNLSGRQHSTVHLHTRDSAKKEMAIDGSHAGWVVGSKLYLGHLPLSDHSATEV